MISNNYLHKYATIILIISLILFLSSLPAASVTKGKLPELTEQEQKIKEEIFNLQRQIEHLEKEQENIQTLINTNKEELKQIKFEQKKAEENFQEIEEKVSRLFQSMQKMGNLSYLELLLKANNLTEFLQRLTIIKDVLHNITELFAEYREKRQSLTQLESETADKISQLESLEQELNDKIETISNKKETQTQLKEEIKSQIAEYEVYMERIEEDWLDKAKPMLVSLTDNLSTLVEDERFHEDMISVTGSFFSPKATITEDTFNSIINKKDNIQNVRLEFTEDQVLIKFPDQQLTLTGIFELKNSTKVSYNIQEVHFTDISLNKQVFSYLIEDIDITIDFKSLLGNYHLTNIHIKDSELVLDLSIISF